MNYPYNELTNIILEMKNLSRQLEDIWDRVDPTTCDIVYEPLQVQHLPCDSCEEKEDDNSID